MHHSHFDSIHSTQIYLRDNLLELNRNGNEILISAGEQTFGIGRSGSTWDSVENSIAMSFTLKPNPAPTLTPLEIGILTAQFLKKEFNADIFIKWPNDLLTSSGKKCGGIISQYIDAETVISGIGLNLGKLSSHFVPESYKQGIGSVTDLIFSKFDLKEISMKIYLHILKNRIDDAKNIQSTFLETCYHIDKFVQIEDEGKILKGKFLGVGRNGEALIEIEGKTHSCISSSLKILD
jgi:BirA family biotin operon repressor/biotin-[acetyl-CoA-carboxylase] ligase